MNSVDGLAVVVFSVVVRTVGLLCCLVSGAFLYFALVNLVLGGPANAVGIIIIVGPVFLVGLWLLRGAPSVVAFAFPRIAEHPSSLPQVPRDSSW